MNELLDAITVINLFGPVVIVAGVILCVTGKMDWWVFAFVIFSQIQIPLDFQAFRQHRRESREPLWRRWSR